MHIWNRCALVVVVAVIAACEDGAPPTGGGNPPAANSAPIITSAASVVVSENIAAPAYRVTATDADGNTIAFSISGGADAARFTVNGATGDISFVTPPDFEAPADVNGDNVYEITVAASDGMAQATLAVSITVQDVVESFQVRRRGTGFSQPLFVAGAGDGSGRVFVVEKGGLIRILNPATGAVNAAPFLDVSGVITTAGERGLLGLAFAPNYSASGFFYIQVSVPSGETQVRRYRVSAGDPDLADAGSGDVILSFAHPSGNHRSGWIGFGNDGFLYISSGDGDAAVDASNPGQDTTTLLGKMLRIDISGDDFPADAARDYRIPASNPFAAGGGLPEIYAYGLRNPFRASFDSASGDLLIGDVGEGTREEIDLIPAGSAGLNFGWSRFEGTFVIVPAESAPGAVPPVLEYNHGAGPFEGNSVTGGVVNRGPVPALQGHYIFGDFVNANIWSAPVAALVQGTTLTSGSFTRQTDAFLPDVGAINNISSFGTDDNGNVYIVDFDGEIFRFEAL